MSALTSIAGVGSGVASADLVGSGVGICPNPSASAIKLESLISSVYTFTDVPFTTGVGVAFAGFGFSVAFAVAFAVGFVVFTTFLSGPFFLVTVTLTVPSFLVFPFFLTSFTVILAVPFFRPVTTPFFDTLATFFLLLLNVYLQAFFLFAILIVFFFPTVTLIFFVFNFAFFAFAPASGAVIPPSVIDKAKIPDKTTPLTRFHCFMAVPPLHYIVIIFRL